MVKGDYGKDYYQRGVGRLSSLVKLFYLDRWRTIKRWLSGCRVLEVGYGDGGFMRYLGEKGLKVGGWEYGAKLGEKIGQGEADMVVSYHSMEHWKNLDLMMRKITKTLRPGGVLIVRLPVGDNWEFAVAGENWFHVDSQYHQYIFSRKSLDRLAKKYKLRIVETNHGVWDFRQTAAYSWWSYFSGKECSVKCRWWLLWLQPVGIVFSWVASWVFRSTGVIEVVMVK